VHKAIAVRFGTAVSRITPFPTYLIGS